MSIKRKKCTNYESSLVIKKKPTDIWGHRVKVIHRKWKNMISHKDF